MQPLRLCQEKYPDADMEHPAVLWSRMSSCASAVAPGRSALLHGITRNLFRVFLPALSSLPSSPFFPSLPLPFPSLSFVPKWLLKFNGFRGALLAPPEGKNICSNQTRSLASKYSTRKMHLRPALGRKRIFSVFRAQGTCLLAAMSSHFC